MRHRSSVLSCLAVHVLACTGSPDPGTTYAARDSAGIRIVESVSPAWTEGDGWEVDPDPVFDLSGQDDEELYRPGIARLLADGRLVLFNGGTCSVRFYDSGGRLLASSGRCGEGPGEFGESARIRPWRGDSLLVTSRIPSRATILDGEGTPVRTAMIPNSEGLPLPVVEGVFADGTILLRGLRDPAGRDTPGLESAQYTLALIRDLLDAPRLLGTYPGPVYEYVEFGGGMGRDALAFGGAARFGFHPERFFVGVPDRYEIRVFTPSGALHRIVRRPFEPVRVTRDDIEWLMERRLAQVDGAENQAAVRQAYRDLRHAEVMPAFGVPVWPGGAEGGPDMLADVAGNLWVFEHYRPGEYRNRWTVFSPEGVWLGTVMLPDGLEPSQIGEDFVLGRWTDELGFVHVRLHALDKP